MNLNLIDIADCVDFCRFGYSSGEFSFEWVFFQVDINEWDYVVEGQISIYEKYLKELFEVNNL